MKRRILTCTALLSLFCLGQLSAERDAGPSGPNKQAGESRMLMHLLKMDDAELGKLRETVERIEAMSPEERARKRQQLKQLRQMDPGKRERLRQHFQSISEDQRREMRQRWNEMSPEERRAWRMKLRGMNPKGRAKAIQDADLIPPKGLEENKCVNRTP